MENILITAKLGETRFIEKVKYEPVVEERLVAPTIQDLLKGITERVETVEYLKEVVVREEVEGFVPNRTVTFLRDKTWLNRAVTEGKIRVPNYSAIVGKLDQFSHYQSLSNEEKHGHYSVFSIPKANGKLRTIKAPKEGLKEVQRQLKNILEYDLGMLHHNSAFAYIKTRSVKDSLTVHRQNESKWFLKIDLKNFFDNCTPEFIATQLRKMYPLAQMEDQQFTILLNAIIGVGCLDNGLPQGTPLSPTLTNLIMVEFDKWMTDFAHKNALRYTRYADDILISSKYNFKYWLIEKEIKKFMADHAYPFTVNESKTRYGSSAGSNWNLGLMLNKDNNITVGYRLKKQLKTMMFNLYRNSDEWGWEEKTRLRGELEWLRCNEPDYHRELISWFNAKHKTNIYALMK